MRGPIIRRPTIQPREFAAHALQPGGPRRCHRGEAGPPGGPAHQRLDEQRVQGPAHIAGIAPSHLHHQDLAAKQAVHRRVGQCRRPILVIAGRRRHPHPRRMGQIGGLAVASTRFAAIVRHRRRPVPGHAVETLLVPPLATPAAETVGLRRRPKCCRRRQVHPVLTRFLRRRRLRLPVLVGTGTGRRPEPQHLGPVPATRPGSRAGARGRPTRSPRGWRG